MGRMGELVLIGPASIRYLIAERSVLERLWLVGTSALLGGEDGVDRIGEALTHGAGDLEGVAP
jgi:hypothetical protein